jgi:CubicO group peptidase (beta-lactamase class C family)
VLQLVEQGKLRLEDRLSKYLPEMTRPGHDPTLLQLLNHTAGLGNYGGPSFHKNIHLDLNARQWLDSVNDEHLYAFEPGRDWAYSNVAYDLLGFTVEKVSATPFADYLQQHVFVPAGMSSTRMCNTPEVVPKRAFGYEHGKNGWEHGESWGTFGDASGRVCSSVKDLAAFWTALESGKLLSGASLKLMQESSHLGNGASFDYGLGTRLGQLDGHALVAHTGDGESWSSALVAMPDHRIAVIVLANADSPVRPARAIAVAILRRVASLPEPDLHDLPVERDLLRKIPGNWGSQQPAELSATGTHLAFKPAGAPVDPVPLLYLGHGEFQFPAESPAPDVSIRFDIQHQPYVAQAFSNEIFEGVSLKQ